MKKHKKTKLNKLKTKIQSIRAFKALKTQKKMILAMPIYILRLDGEQSPQK